VKKHFVRFYSPGTFMAEMTERPIDDWNIKQAVRMSKKVMERYNAKPYGFRFITRHRSESQLDSTIVKESPLYYLSGTISTYKDVVLRNDPKEEILRSNMRCNGYKRVITTQTPWRWTQPLQDSDIVLTEEGEEMPCTT